MTSLPHPHHPVYPYRLRDLPITVPNQVWCTDITDIPMRRGFLYLVAIMDWASRRVLAWRLSKTMETDFRVEALSEVLAKFGRPEIFNTEQGSQFTSPRFTALLKNAGVHISMDGRGRWMDNVFIERLWRSVKYEEVLSARLRQCRAGARRAWHVPKFLQWRRPHSSLRARMPDQTYFIQAPLLAAACKNSRLLSGLNSCRVTPSLPTPRYRNTINQTGRASIYRKPNGVQQTRPPHKSCSSIAKDGD